MSGAPSVWSVTHAGFDGFLRRAERAVLVVAPRLRLRFSAAVAKYFVAEYGTKGVSLGTFDRAQVPTERWLRTVLGDDARDGYYLFRDGRVIAFHDGEVERAEKRSRLQGLVVLAARALDSLDPEAAAAVIEGFELALAGRAAAVDPYEVLKLAPDADDAEVRAARDRELLENHPDRVAQMSAEIRELAARTTQAINDAYAAIRASRRRRSSP